MKNKKKEKKKKLKKKNKTDSKIIKITSPINPDVIIPVLSERADDDIIEADILGKAAEYYIYQFEHDGKMVKGLTVKGITETVRYINTNTNKTHMRLVIDKQSLRKDECEREGQKGVEVTIWVDDMISGQSYPGVKFEAYQKYSKKYKRWYPNTFAVEKATSKSIRNAFRRHFPEHLVQRVIAKFSKDQGKILNLNSVPELDAPDLTETRVIELKPSSAETKMSAVTRGIMALKDEKTIKIWIKKAKDSKEFSKEEKSTVINLLETKLKMLKVK